MTKILTFILLLIGLSLSLSLTLVQQIVYSWPAGTTEAQKDKILSVTSDDQLSIEESSIATDRVYEISDAYDSDRQEYKDLMDCGFVDKLAFEVLQCWEGKGHAVK